jgi:hypothetical protein
MFLLLNQEADKRRFDVFIIYDIVPIINSKKAVTLKALPR